MLRLNRELLELLRFASAPAPFPGWFGVVRGLDLALW